MIKNNFFTKKIKRFKQKYQFWKLIKSINKSTYQNIYIVSAAGYNNFGDDLMIKVLQSIFINKKIYFLIDGINNNPIVISNILKMGISIENNLDSINPNKSLVLIGGGTLFNIKVFSDEIYLKYAQKIFEKKIPYAFIGIEIVNFNNQKIASLVFNNSVFNSVRNIQSKRILSKVSKKAALKTSITGDLVEYFSKKYFIKKSYRLLGICISPISKIKIEDFLKIIIKYQNKGYHVELFSFCNHPFSDQESDAAFFKQIQKLNPQVSLFSTNDFASILYRLKQYSFIITTRLHVTIIGSQLNIKIINISDEEKNKNYCNNNNICSTNLKKLLINN